MPDRAAVAQAARSESQPFDRLSRLPGLCTKVQTLGSCLLVLPPTDVI